MCGQRKVSSRRGAKAAGPIEALRGDGDAQTRAGAGSAEHRRAKQQACAGFDLDGNSEVGSEVGWLHGTQWQFRLDRGRQRPNARWARVLVILLVLAKERRYSHTRAISVGKWVSSLAW